MFTIEPVQPKHYEEALKLIFTTANNRHISILTNLHAIVPLLNSKRCNLYWVRQRTRIIAAGIAIHNPGKVAIIYHSRCPTANDIIPFSQLIGNLARLALLEGADIVEILLTHPSNAEVQALKMAGFIHLARLIHMSRPLENLPFAQSQSDELEWNHFNPGDENKLAKMLPEMLVDSLDCPAMCGLRKVEDIIEGYKASGIFRADSWWLPQWKGNDIGCILMNDSIVDEQTSFIVYLGVIPRWRRMGFARAMLRHAFRYAYQREIKNISLSVDARNTPAIRLYRQEGFTPIKQQDVFITHIDAKKQSVRR